jgi:superfamily I DNA/RNA helicase
MAMRAVKSGGRICAVGDPRQAIYGFRGADSTAVDNVVSRLQATVLPLSVCYRCCKAVIREAQTVVPGIESAPNAEEGSVSDVTVKEMKRGARPGDFILSRTNAPLISLCMYFLKEGRPASIQGRDVGASLAAFVKKSKAPSVEALRDYVEAWRNVECARLAAKHRDTQAVEDRAECILAISEDAASVADVLSSIESLFADKDSSQRIVLSSTHKAKGLERERVWLLRSTYMRRPEPEEANLFYVATTRARKTLFMVVGSLK